MINEGVGQAGVTAWLNLDVLKQPPDDRSPGNGFLWDENDPEVRMESDKQLKRILKIKSSDESSSDDASRSLSPDSEWFLGRKRSLSEGGKSRRARSSANNGWWLCRERKIKILLFFKTVFEYILP